MSEPRIHRLETRPIPPEVEEYRALIRQATLLLPDDADFAARELVRLCRFRRRPALLRSTLRFGHGLLLIRVADLDADGQNEMLVIDAGHNVHTPRIMRESNESGGATFWVIGTHRYRGRLLGMAFSSLVQSDEVNTGQTTGTGAPDAVDADTAPPIWQFRVVYGGFIGLVGSEAKRWSEE